MTRRFTETIRNLLIKSDPRSSRRTATHANSWYTGNGTILNSELEKWISDVPYTNNVYESEFSPPIKGCKAIIAPHAGYSYSGPTAAWAYKGIDTSNITRVFVLGPSHHVYLEGCALSACDTYNTPIGDLPLHTATINELKATGYFDTMSLGTDEDEHSIEMHLPYVRKIFEGKDISIVPILVGAIDFEKEQLYGGILAPYLASEDTLFVISSDFCHWGTRFSYTFYYSTPLPCPNPIRLSRSGPQPTASLRSHPIHASITALDHEAMDILHLEAGSSSAEESHAKFSAYLNRTKNTICGRHPIGVLLGALTTLEGQAGDSAKAATLRWVQYAQSSACENVYDSSVSYASAYVTF